MLAPPGSARQILRRDSGLQQWSWLRQIGVGEGVRGASPRSPSSDSCRRTEEVGIVQQHRGFPRQYLAPTSGRIYQTSSRAGHAMVLCPYPMAVMQAMRDIGRGTASQIQWRGVVVPTC